MDSFPLPPTKSLLLMVMITMPVSWEMSLVFIECSQVKKVISVEGCFVVTPDFEWLNSL